MTDEPDEQAEMQAGGSAVAMFHRVNSLLPDEQNVVSVSPGTLVREALDLMRKHGFSQLPVVEGDEVLGVFSYRSFSTRVAEMGKVDIDRIEVDDCLEDFEFIRVSGEIEAMFERLDRDGAVLVGDPDRLIAVATATDLVQYLYSVAHPFILIQEIELVLRELVRSAIPDDELASRIRKAVSSRYEGAEERIPVDLVDLSFAELVLTVINGTNYTEKFCKIFGRNRESARGYLDPIPRIRNEIFHFRKPATGDDMRTLINTRTWLLRKARTIKARGGSKP